MAHVDAREGKWRGNWRTEWVVSTLHTTSEHGVSSITTADAHTSAASRLKWRPRRFKWTCPSRRKTKSDFWACAITFQTQSTYLVNGTTFAKLLFDKKCVFFFIFSKIWSENFLITRRIQRDIVAGVNKSSCAWYFCTILNKLEFYRHILTKNIEFHYKYSIGKRVFPRIQTDGQIFMTLNSHVSQLCKRV